MAVRKNIPKQLSSGSERERDPDDVLLLDAEVREMLGGVSHMFIIRRERDDTTFPARIYLGRRKARWRSEVLAWIERRPRRAERSPQAGNLRGARARAAAAEA